MAVDLLGNVIKHGDFVVQACSFGNHKWLKVAVVLDYNEEKGYVKVQSESRPGNVTSPSDRLLVISSSMLKEDVKANLTKMFNSYNLKHNVYEERLR